MSAAEIVLMSIMIATSVTNVVSFLRFRHWYLGFKARSTALMDEMKRDRDNATADLEKEHWSRNYLNRHKNN